MRIDYADNGRTATVEIEDYPDLLQCRSLSEWRFIGETTVETTVEHLTAAGITDTKPETIEWLPFNPTLFAHQEWIVKLALDRERFAMFADAGFGKSFMECEWARQVTAYHGGRTLIVAPLSVCPQTIEEAEKFYGDDLKIADLRERSDLAEWLESGSGIGITNFEKIDGTTEALPVEAVVIDESSALKASMGSRRTAIIAAFKGVRWKLCGTATPAPNDRVEYAEHAYFLDQVRSTREFLAAFFVNRDGSWQLKAHGVDAFYRHLASWSVFMRSPKRYGFPDVNEDIPPMTIGHGFLLDGGKVVDRFPTLKPQVIADLCNIKHSDEPVLVWVTFDEEANQLAELIPDSIQLSGKTSQKRRDEIIEGFRAGDGPRVLICKPAMCSFGLNFQACRIQVFSTITDSWERTYQAIRRSYRFGQTKPVIVYIPITDMDTAMCTNVMSKQSTYDQDAIRQEEAFISVLRPKDTAEKRVIVTEPQAEIDRAEGDNWTMIHGDCIAHMPTMDADSMDLAVFSLPFANLFTYSSAIADMGNVKSDIEYKLQWKFFAERLYRVMKPGRNVAIHIQDIIRFAGQHGVRHTYDFPSDVRDGMQAAGFLYRSRISIDKDPQLQAVRTKDNNLLFVTLERDALDSHSQAGEYVLVFSKPGKNEVPVKATDITNTEWIRWAHHIWYDIRETDVLNAALAREDADERHLCALQLGLIERCVRLWSNPGETVLSPFAGIGSEGYESLSWGRKFYGVELKQSYWQTGCNFLAAKEHELSGRLFEPSARMYADVLGEA